MKIRDQYLSFRLWKHNSVPYKKKELKRRLCQYFDTIFFFMYKARTLLLAHLPNHKEELLLLKVHPVLQITSGSALYVSAFPTAYQVPTKGKKDQSVFKKARYLLEKAPFLFLKDHYLFEKALALFTKRLCLFGST